MLIEVTRHDNGHLAHINTTEVRLVTQESDAEFIWGLIVFNDGSAVKVKDDHVDGKNPLERIKKAEQWGIRALIECVDRMTRSQYEAIEVSGKHWQDQFERQDKVAEDTERRHAEHLAFRAGKSSSDAIDSSETPEAQIAYWKAAATDGREQSFQQRNEAINQRNIERALRGAAEKQRDIYRDELTALVFDFAGVSDIDELKHKHKDRPGRYTIAYNRAIHFLIDDTDDTKAEGGES